MESKLEEKDLEKLCFDLNDDEAREAYKALYDDYKPSLIPRILGAILVGCGSLVYGSKPSLLKFRSVEVIARVPYHSWTASVYTVLTMFYWNEEKALSLSCINEYAQHGQDNETMHVVAISHITKDEGLHAGLFRHTLIPMIFAFFYYWSSYLLHLMCSRYSYELNFLFEEHAYEQYDQFIRENEKELREKKLECKYVEWYGRTCATQYDFFCSVRNDELIHRNSSIEETC